MPSKESTDCSAVLQRTKSVLIRLDSERAQFKANKAYYNKCTKDSVDLLQHIAESGPAQLNVVKFRKMVIQLEGAYKMNALNLEESAEISEQTSGQSRALAILYCCVALGKIMDVVAAVTGVGKWITTSKTAIIDIADSMKNENIALAGAQAANLTLIGAKEGDFLKTVEDLQAILSSIIELVKDAKTALNARKELNQVKADAEIWAAKVGALTVKGVDVLQRVTKLYDEYLILAKKLPAPMFDSKRIQGVQEGWWGHPKYQMKMTDYFAAVKAGLDAIVNFYQAYLAMCQMRADSRGAAEARGLAANQMQSQGYGGVPFELQMQTWARLTDADFVTAIHAINSAPDAHLLNADLRILARQFTQRAENMRVSVSTVKARIQPSLDKLNQTIAGLKATDAELAGLRRELERFSAQIVDVRSDVNRMNTVIDRNKELEKLGVPAFLGVIDMERRKIAEDLAAVN